MLVHFKVDFFDTIDNKMAKDSGILAGADWNEVMEMIETYYGKDDVSGVYVCPLEDVLTADDIRGMFKED